MHEEKPKNALLNPDFTQGLQGWSTEGDVILLAKTSTAKAQVRLGPGASALRQRYKVGGLKTLWFGVNLSPRSAEVSGRVRVACYDEENQLRLEAMRGLDKKALVAGSGYASIYLKTHAYTAYVVLSIESDATTGPLLADSALLQDDSLGKKKHPASCNLDDYLLPFWQGPLVHDETVLLLSEAGEQARGKLLYMPQRVLSVRDYGQQTIYTEGLDYTVTGNVLTALPGSRISTLHTTDFDQGDLKWYKLAGKHLTVTYTHQGNWQGPPLRYEGDKLPETMRKLTKRIPLTVVAYGDSITHGTGTSGDTQISPYMPTWAELFVHGLKRRYQHERIQLYNTALGGMTSDWGRENATAIVASLNPDLVLIAFGMNDFWSLSPERFRSNTLSIIQQLQSQKPSTEVILIASMRFDPAYTKDPSYRTRMDGYVKALRSFVRSGIRLLDMDAISEILMERKKPKDLISDPLHPNDYLARWYAQGLLTLLELSRT
jgi:lysophospholipase L1-like esterase